MISFVKTNFNYDISEYIKQNINIKSTLITPKKSINYFKKVLISKKLNLIIDVLDFNSLMIDIYKTLSGSFKILDINKQKLFFIKAFNNVDNDLKLLKGYDTAVINNIIDIYNKECQFSLKRTPYESEMINDIYLVINEYLRLISGIYEDNNTLYNKILKFSSENNQNYIFTNINDYNNLEIDIIKKLGENNNVIIFIYNDELLNYNRIIFNNYNYLKNSMVEDDIINSQISAEKQAILDKTQYDKVPNSVSLFEAKDLYDEVLYINNQIMKLIKEDNASANDFTIVVNNLSDYENYFDLIFRNQIAYNKKETIDHKFFEKVRELIINLDKKINEDSLKELFEIVFTYFKNNNYDFEVNSNTWDSFINFIDNYMDVFSNSTIDLEHFISIFDDYFKDFKISKQYNNEIKVISLKDVLNIKTKYIFFIGILEGIIPSGLKNNILINTPEVIYENYPTFDDIIKEQFNVLFLLFQDNLFLSYPKINIDNKKVNSSSIIKDIRNIYPNIKLISNNIDLYSYSNKNTFNNYKALFDINTIKKLNSYFTKKNIYNKYLDFDKKINDFYNPLPLNKNIYEKVLNNKLYLSASKIDTYVKCPFKYFLENVIKLNPNIDEIYDSRIVGTFVHGLLEKLINNLEIDPLMVKDNYVIEFINDHLFLQDYLYRYFIDILGMNTLHIWKSIKNELLNSAYSPLYTEINVNKNINIKNINYKVAGVDVFMTGIIDRIDKYNNFIRIIDYKTGEKKIDYNDLVNGLNMQLFIYMKIMSEQENTIVSGIFYMPVLAKFDDVENYKLKGIFLNNEENISALGGDNINEYIEAFSRGKINNNILFNEDKYEKINQYTDKKICEIANDIITGKIDITPIKSTNICKYCKFKAICGTEDKTKNNHKLVKMSKDEIEDVLRGDNNG